MKLTPLCLVVTATISSAQIAWEPTFERAKNRARSENKVIVSMFVADGERASENLMRGPFKDLAIKSLSARTINVFCSNGTHGKGDCPRCGSGRCSDHRNNDYGIRKQVLDTQHEILAPQIVFLSPDGKVLFSAAGRITVGELEWLWVHAIRHLDPQFSWESAGRFRAPSSFKKGSADLQEHRRVAPPTSTQVQSALKAAKKSGSGRGWGPGRGGFGRPDPNMEILVRSSDPKAITYGEAQLKASRFGRARLIESIGRVSPNAWYKTIPRWLSSKNTAVRRAAIEALGRFAEPKSGSALRAQFKKETDTELRGRLLRAMVTAAPTNRATEALIKKTLRKDPSEIVRAHATIAAGLLENRELITSCLQSALEDKSVLVRRAAAYVIAARLDRELTAALDNQRGHETDAETKDWMAKARTALVERDPSAFSGFLDQTLDVRTNEPDPPRAPGRRAGGGRRFP